MTIKDDLLAEKAALEARLPEIEAELAKGESYLEMEYEAAVAWAEGIVQKIKTFGRA